MIQVGDRFRCADEDCACELESTKIPKNLELEDGSLEAKSLCLCGEEMELLPNSRTATS